MHFAQVLAPRCLSSTAQEGMQSQSTQALVLARGSWHEVDAVVAPGEEPFPGYSTNDAGDDHHPEAIRGLPDQHIGNRFTTLNCQVSLSRVPEERDSAQRASRVVA
jgi:hypothetical protein